MFDIYQVAQILIINVTLLNLLIAILSDIYNKVSLMYKSERLKAKCKLINENEIFFNRTTIFKHTKYIVRAEIE